MTENTRHLLHVDDDPLVLEFVESCLVPHGYRVTSIDDPRTVLERLENSQCRVMLLDIDMPHIDGLTLLREIKHYDGGVQVIMLTGLVSMSTVLQSMRWGAEACVFKSMTNMAPLLDALETTFLKTDRWWATLRDFKAREQQAPARQYVAATDPLQSRNDQHRNE